LKILKIGFSSHTLYCVVTKSERHTAVDCRIPTWYIVVFWVYALCAREQLTSRFNSPLPLFCTVCVNALAYYAYVIVLCPFGICCA